VKLTNIGEQLQKLNATIDGMGPVNDLPVVARARSRKEKNKLASRYGGREGGVFVVRPTEQHHLYLSI
jgi:hypothetical protein